MVKDLVAVAEAAIMLQILLMVSKLLDLSTESSVIMIGLWFPGSFFNVQLLPVF